MEDGQPWSGAKAAGENSKIKRKDSATSPTVGSAGSRGRAHRDHREELLHEGDAGADANVIVALRLREQGGGVVPLPSRPTFTRKPYVIAFATPVRPEWRWRIVNYAGEMVEAAVGAVTEELKKLSKSTKDKKEIAQVATVAANNDKTIGNLIAEAMEKVGKDGVITVEEAKSADTVLDLVEGMQFDRGYLSPYFVTDAERMEVVLEDAIVLIHEKKISVMKDMLPLLEQVARAGKPFLIIAEDVEGEA